MPHDKNGILLKSGDKVLVPCTVTQINGSDDNKYCNVSLETDEKMGQDDPNAYKVSLVLNAKQVLKATAAIALVAFAVFIAGCGTLKLATLQRIQFVAEAAAYGGTQGALIEVPGWKADFEAAQARIQKLADSGHVTPADLAQFMSTLKISELKSKEVRLGISSARTVYLLASGTTTAINADALSLAAARGIAEGMRKALAGE